MNELEFELPLLLRSHKDTDLRPLLVSTVTRMWCELHVRDVKHFRSGREELAEEGAPMAVDGEGPLGGGPQGPPSVSVVIAGKNRDYPHRLAGFIRDKEYVERLLELVGGCPRLPEAGALTADQIYAQVKTDSKTSPAEALQQQRRACRSSFSSEAAATGGPVWRLRQQIPAGSSRALGYKQEREILWGPRGLG